MSEIKFIQAFGDELDRMIATDNARQQPAARQNIWTRLRRLARSHRPLAIILVAVTVAGCTAATVALTASPSQTTAAYGLTCEINGFTWAREVKQFGVDNSMSGIYTDDPLASCAATFRANARKIPADGLIACVSPTQGVFVFARTGANDQCLARRMAPFNASYRRAMLQVQQLQTAMERIYLSRECWTPSALTAATESELKRYHFVGWRASYIPTSTLNQPILPGHCGAYGYPGTTPGVADNSESLTGLDPLHHLAIIIATAPLNRVNFTTMMSTALNKFTSSQTRIHHVTTVAQFEAFVRRTMTSLELPGWNFKLNFVVQTEPRELAVNLWQYEHDGIDWNGIWTSSGAGMDDNSGHWIRDADDGVWTVQLYHRAGNGDRAR